MHVSIIDDLPLIQHHYITCTNTDLLLSKPLGMIFSEIWIKNTIFFIQENALSNMEGYLHHAYMTNKKK